MYFTYQEAADLLEFFGGDEETEITVIEVTENDPCHSGPGLYAGYSEYLEEGTTLLENGRQSHNPSLKADKRDSCQCKDQIGYHYCGNCGRPVE